MTNIPSKFLFINIVQNVSIFCKGCLSPNDGMSQFIGSVQHKIWITWSLLRGEVIRQNQTNGQYCVAQWKQEGYAFRKSEVPPYHLGWHGPCRFSPGEMALLAQGDFLLEGRGTTQKLFARKLSTSNPRQNMFGFHPYVSYLAELPWTDFSGKWLALNSEQNVFGWLFPSEAHECTHTHKHTHTHTHTQTHTHLDGDCTKPAVSMPDGDRRLEKTRTAPCRQHVILLRGTAMKMIECSFGFRLPGVDSNKLSSLLFAWVEMEFSTFLWSIWWVATGFHQISPWFNFKIHFSGILKSSASWFQMQIHLDHIGSKGAKPDSQLFQATKFGNAWCVHWWWRVPSGKYDEILSWILVREGTAQEM